MARATKGSESKQGLVITLVFSVIITFAAGIAAYFGFAEQEALKDDKKQSEAAKVSMQKDRDFQKFQNVMLKAYVGINLSEKEENDLIVLRKQFKDKKLGQAEENKAEVEAMVKKLDDLLRWNEGKNKPDVTLLANDLKLTKEMALNTATMSKLDANHQTAVKNLSGENGLLGAKQVELETVKKTNTKLTAEKKDAQEKKGKEFIEAIDRNKKKDEEIDEQNKKFQVAEADYKKKIEGLEQKLKDLQTKYETYVIKVAPIDLVEHDTAKGAIVSIDQTGRMAYINLGSSDNVKPQLSFSIFSAGSSGKTRKERKAAVEVVNVLEAHMSMARIIDVTDPTRDPVIKGDLLFNPAWTPSLRQHIAIAGLIDITGDGSDGSVEFMRNLRKQNIEIDSYIDLKDVTVKGMMSFKTNFLVIGDMPSFAQNDPIKEGDPRTDRIKDIMAKMSEFQTDAAIKGVTVVPYRRFISLVGYKLPKSIAPPDYISRFSGGNAVPAEAKMPDKGEKADKGDKDKPEKEKADKEKPDKADKEKADKEKADKVDKDKADKEKADKVKADKDKDK